MRQYKLCIQNDNNNNNNKMDKSKIKAGGHLIFRRERGVKGENLFLIFFLFVSFSDLRKLDRRFSSRLKVKLIYVMRATLGHQNLGVSSNSMR